MGMNMYLSSFYVLVKLIMPKESMGWAVFAAYVLILGHDILINMYKKMVLVLRNLSSNV